MAMNLVGKVEALEIHERQFLVKLLREAHSNLDVSVGSLPFVSSILASDTLRDYIKRFDSGKRDGYRSSPECRHASKLLEKLTSNKLPLFKFTMYLDDILVFRRSRGDSTVKRVMTLGSKKTVPAGLQFNYFKGRYVQPEKQVSNQCLLTRIEPGHWEVLCELSVVNSAKRDLKALCGAEYPRLRKKRGRWV